MLGWSVLMLNPQSDFSCETKLGETHCGGNVTGRGRVTAEMLVGGNFQLLVVFRI